MKQVLSLYSTSSKHWSNKISSILTAMETYYVIETIHASVEVHRYCKNNQCATKCVICLQTNVFFWFQTLGKYKWNTRHFDCLCFPRFRGWMQYWKGESWHRECAELAIIGTLAALISVKMKHFSTSWTCLTTQVRLIISSANSFHSLKLNKSLQRRSRWKNGCFRLLVFCSNKIVFQRICLQY